VARESMAVISQKGREVISLALNLLLNVGTGVMANRPWLQWQAGTCLRKSNWKAAMGNNKQKQMFWLPGRAHGEPGCAVGAERERWLLNIVISLLPPSRYCQVQLLSSTLVLSNLQQFL
jgi:hypothetical protein